MHKKKTRLLQYLAACVLVVFVIAAQYFHSNQELPANAASPVSQSVQSAQTKTTQAYTFRNDSLWKTHYQKHGGEFGEITQEEYLQRANALISSKTALRKTEKEDGDTVVYEESQNEFLILSQDGYIRTFFKPDDGLAYYERQ